MMALSATVQGLCSPPLAELLRRTLRDYGRMALYVAALSASGGMTSLRFLLLSRLVQAGLDGQTGAIAWWLAAVVAVWLLGQAAEYGATSVGLLFERSVGVQIVRDKVHNLIKDTQEHAHHLEANQVVHLLRNGLVVVARTVRSALGAVQRLILALVTVGTAFALQPECALVCLAASLAVLVRTARLIGQQRQGATTALHGQQELHARLCRLFAALPQVKLYGAGKTQLDRLSDPIGKQLGGEEASLRAQRQATLETNIAAAVTGLLVLALGSWLLTLGRTSVADLAAMLVLQQSVFTGLRQTLLQWSLAEENSEYLNQLIDTRHATSAGSATPVGEAVPGLKTKTLTQPIREISCEKATFAIGDIVLIREATCRLEHGRLYAVAGPSGAGKSMLLHLLSGHSRLHSGSLKYNGHPVEELDPLDVRKRITLSAWPPLVLQGTIEDNLRMAKPDATPDQIAEVLRMAALDRDIEQLRPAGGLGAVVGRKGVQLSVGQWQRLALARAFLRSPEVLLLDDLLTGLDPETGQTVLASLRRWSRDRIVVFVLPNESALAYCDAVLLVRLGRVVAQVSALEARQSAAWEEAFRSDERKAA